MASSEGIGARSPPACRVRDAHAHRHPPATSDDARVGDALDRGAEPLLGGERGIDAHRLEPLEPVLREEEGRQHDQLGQRALGLGLRARPDQRRDRHHRALAVVIDRGVRHLGEPLPEVRRERSRAAGERRDRGVVSHRVHGIAARLGDRAQHEAELLARVAVQRVARDEVGLGGGAGLAPLEERDARVDPRGVRLAPRELALQLAVEEQPALGVDREDLARAEARAADCGALRERDRAGLRADGDQAVVADGDAQRPQPVAVERRTARDAVREDEARQGRPRARPASRGSGASPAPRRSSGGRSARPAARASSSPRGRRGPTARGARAHCRGPPSRSPMRSIAGGEPFVLSRAPARAPPSRRRCRRWC